MEGKDLVFLKGPNGYYYIAAQIDKAVFNTFAASLAGKADIEHSHTPADIAGLLDALSGKANASDLSFESSARASADTALGARVTALENGGGGGSSITVDSSFLANSTNPVQSKVIQAALKSFVLHVNSFAEISEQWNASAAMRGLEKVYICDGTNTTDLGEMLKGHIYHLILFPETYEYTYEDTTWEAEWSPTTGWAGHWEETTETALRLSTLDLLPDAVPRDYFLRNDKYVSETGEYALYVSNQSWFVYDTSISDIASLIASSGMNPPPEGVYDLQYTPGATEVLTGVEWISNEGIIWHAHVVTRTVTGFTFDYLWRDITAAFANQGAAVFVFKNFSDLSDYWKKNYSEDGWENVIVIGDKYDSFNVNNTIGSGKRYKIYFYQEREALFKVGEDTEPQGVLRLSLPSGGSWIAKTGSGASSGTLIRLVYEITYRHYIYAHINRTDGTNAYIDYLYENISKPDPDYSTSEVEALDSENNIVEPGKVYSLVMEEDFTLETEWDGVGGSSYGESVLFVEPGEYTFSVDDGITLDPSVLMTSGYRYRLLVSFTPFGIFVEQTAEWEIPASEENNTEES